MPVILHDLVGAGDRRFSPNCWRTRMALAHKGLPCEARPTRFTEIAGIAGGGRTTVPVIEDDGKVVVESWAIANYLEQAYADRPTLFGGPAGRALTYFYNNWTNTVLHPAIVGLIVLDVHDRLTPEDRAYFRESREKRFGRRLEEVQAGREARLDGFRQLLGPLRGTLAGQPFLGGDGPLYADHIVFGAFQWLRVMSPLPALEPADPVAAWTGRCLKLYDGLAGAMPAA